MESFFLPCVKKIRNLITNQAEDIENAGTRLKVRKYPRLFFQKVTPPPERLSGRRVRRISILASFNPAVSRTASRRCPASYPSRLGSIS
jgi:hypothetical protein